MKFIVQKEVFSKLPQLCFGIVAAKGINNQIECSSLDNYLAEGIENVKRTFEGENIKEHRAILPYRNAFSELGYNPNKFLCSIEALSSRIIKGGQIPRINTLVDLVNAVSLKWILPMGAHDTNRFNGNIELRFSKDGDIFTPFGTSEAELVEPGELVYASGNKVKTRKWIWRQSEDGKITTESTDIFFPIDGFMDKNYEAVIEARDELADKLYRIFRCDIKTGYVNNINNEYEL